MATIGLITGLKLVWKDLDDKADDNFDQERMRIDPNLSANEFRDPFPEDFYGYNIKQFIRENAYPSTSNEDWKWIDKSNLKEKEIYKYKITTQKFWSIK